MKAVNLLPERHRPRRPSGGAQGSSLILLGVLGVVLIGAVVYVLTLNSINSARNDVAQAKADTARYQAQSSQLGPYGDFSKIKTQRVDAVRQLAEGRFDWERLVRELSSVLPDGVWLQSAAAADSAANAADTQAGAGFQQGSSTSSAGANAPVMTLQGCARNQTDVATTLVRLHELQGADQVQLDNSTRPSQDGGGGGSSSASGGGGDCGTTGGSPNYSFQVDVSFVPSTPGPYVPGKVPNALGGGQ